MPSNEFETLPNIYLVGPMGAGKTTVGRHLAEMLGREFLDSDHEIERKTGATIPWIFEKEGEHGFRGRETLVIDELTARSQLVLATGGGAVTQQPNREFLKKRGIVVYLYTPVEIQLQRTYRDKNRPLLQVENPEKSCVIYWHYVILYIATLRTILLKPIRVLHVIWHKKSSI